MAMLMVREQLKYEVEALPEQMAAEVLDFVLFVKARHNEEAHLWRQVEAAHDRRLQHPEDVLTVTAAEWDTLTAELESEADDNIGCVMIGASCSSLCHCQATCAASPAER